MSPLLYSLLLTLNLYEPTNSLSCHWCSHKNSKEAASLKIHDKVQSSPEQCEEKRVCEGNWCVQSLVGGNVSFSCTDQTPLHFIWQTEEIFSHCTASFDVDGISHATCWCRSHDFCNSFSSSFRPMLTTIFTILTLRLFYSFLV